MKLFRLACLATLLAIVTSCGTAENGASDVEQKPVVALIMKSLANEFFVNMADGAREHHAGSDNAYELLINGLKDESDLTQQVALVEQMIARQVDVIVIAPADSKALIPVLKRAADAGIVVVNIDNKLDAGILRDSAIGIPFVGPDNRAGARLAGEYLATRLSPDDDVGIVGGIPTAFNAQQRSAGFKDAMTAGGMNVVNEQSGDWAQQKASVVTAAMISEHPSLKAILAANDNMAMGAIAAIRQAGKSGDILVVGFDNISATHDLLRSGELLATVDQYGGQLAIFGIEYALGIIASGTVPEDRDTPVTLITADDI